MFAGYVTENPSDYRPGFAVETPGEVAGGANFPFPSRSGLAKYPGPDRADVAELVDAQR